MTSSRGSVGITTRPQGFTSNSSPTLRQRAVRLWQYRRILRLLVARDLKVRYAGSILGYVWTVLEPLLMTLVYWFIFTKVFPRSIGYQPYVLFLVTGQITWAWFNGSVIACTRAFVNESQMIRSTSVPRELWVLRVVCSRGIEYFFSLPVIALFAVINTKGVNHNIVYLPIAWVMIFVLSAGVGLLLAPLNVLVTDVERIVPILLRMMFYLSPVLYSLANATQGHSGIASVYGINPMVGPLIISKSVFFHQELHWNYVLHSGLVCIAVFAIGLFTFLRLERQVLKEV